ncbi:TPA: hypothetical protein DD425_02855 [Candidatus Saccharibacteria bacterium]|nr:hypothetical protein [Candidatus Saccharibacteria bacterium]|tara:strand:- start:66 stop:773 length:708 start_codon:yes stop_codon:yes gene_type:complete
MVTELFDAIWAVIGTLVVTVVLALIAGFSPTLYAVQLGVAKTKRYQPYALALMVGVIASFVTLLFLFQFFQPQILISFINSTVDAFFVSKSFNIFIGTLLVIGGVWYLYHKRKPRLKKSTFEKAGLATIFGIGYIRSITSLSGIIATFMASNIINEVSGILGMTILFSVLFLVVSVIPFAVLMVLTQRHPHKLEKFAESIKGLFKRVNLQLAGGITAISIGVGIILINVVAFILS